MLCTEIDIPYSCGHVTYLAYTCDDPESLARGGPTLTTFYF